VDAKLPPLLPDLPTQPISQAAAQPCFLATGDAPTDNTACSADQMQPQPDFDGTQTFYNSGWLEDQQVFTVKLASTIAPGTYNYFCLLHREGMSGTITIVDKATAVAKPADQTATGTQALADMVSKLQPEFDKLASLTADTAQAGAVSQDVQEAEVNEFGAKDLTISTGGSVTWTVFGPHSIAFNAPESARPILKKDADGTVSFNEEGLNPAPEGSPGQVLPDPNAPPDESAPPPDENAPPTLIDGGAWDGQGFRSSGLILSFGPGDPGYSAYKLTFSTAGTYTYICTVHTDMQGTITVQ
jgi:plastocyanin